MITTLLQNRKAIATLLAALLVGGYVFADWYRCYPIDEPRAYVGRQTCAECHQAEVTAWNGSHHDRAMEVASEESVLGDFNDSQFTHAGVTTKFFRRDGRFMVRTEGRDGELQDFEIKFTFGVEPLQQYMVEFPDGRIQVLRVSWDTQRQQWFYEGPPDVPDDERILPDDPLHWTGVAHNWNGTCAECHSTNLDKNYQPASDTYDTTWSEIDVSCESCHGPASLHLKLATGRSLFWDRQHGYGLARLKGASTTPQLETCAQCHSRRHQIAEGFQPGDPFSDYFRLAVLEPGMYHADGQILDEVYVHGSFLQSKMHAEGVRCTDCHNPHSLQLKFTGNELCNQCHTPGKYDSPTHHHHPPDTEGAQCINCHMRSETYMVVDPRRDHSFRVPRPDLTAELGTPNACNDCHTEPGEDADWAATEIAKWRGTPRPAGRHFAYAFDAAIGGDRDAVEQLTDVLSDRNQPGIVKATAAQLLQQQNPGSVGEAQRAALNNFDPLVREAALASLPPVGGDDIASLYSRRLDDSSRNVRIMAARSYLDFLQATGTSPTQLPATVLRNWRSSLDEYRNAQELALDRGAGNINLAELNLQMGNTEKATQLYRRAIQMAPYLAGPRDRLAMLLGDDPGSAERIRELREQEVELLERNAELVSGAADPLYNLGRMHYLLGNLDRSQEALEKAIRRAPDSYDIRLFFTLLLERRAEQAGTEKAWKAATDSATRLAEIRPTDPVAQQLLARFAAQRRGASPPAP